MPPRSNSFEVKDPIIEELPELCWRMGGGSGLSRLTAGRLVDGVHPLARLLAYRARAGFVVPATTGGVVSGRILELEAPLGPRLTVVRP